MVPDPGRMTLRPILCAALSAALVACLTGIAGYAHGVRVGRAHEQAARSRAIAAAVAQTAALQRQLNHAARRARIAEQARQTIFRDIRHDSQTLVHRPVYGTVCVDADGVGLLDRAAATANADDRAPSAGDPAAPAPGPTQ